jgi:hypothetical protein
MKSPANLGAGIIGHGWFEGGFVGVALYALVFGLIVGVADRAIAERAWNPYFIALMGCHLGNVFGLARGDTALFLLEIMVGLFACTCLLWLIKNTYGHAAGAFAPLPLPAGFPADEPGPGPEEASGEAQESAAHEAA